MVAEHEQNAYVRILTYFKSQSVFREMFAQTKMTIHFLAHKSQKSKNTKYKKHEIILASIQRSA